MDGERAPVPYREWWGLFSQRGYNIESLSVAPTEDATLSRLTLTTIGHDRTIEQIIRHLKPHRRCGAGGGFAGTRSAWSAN